MDKLRKYLKSLFFFHFTVTPQIIVPLVMASLLLIAVVLVFYCRRRCP